MKAKRYKQISDTVDQIRTPGGILGGIREGLQELWEECGECLMLIEGAANMLRGMTMDPSIPPHAKEAMQAKIEELEEAIEKYVD